MRKLIPGALGVIIIIITRAHHISINTQLTEAQALIHYWNFWAIGILGIGINAIWDCYKNS